MKPMLTNFSLLRLRAAFVASDDREQRHNQIDLCVILRTQLGTIGMEFWWIHWHGADHSIKLWN